MQYNLIIIIIIIIIIVVCFVFQFKDIVDTVNGIFEEFSLPAFYKVKTVLKVWFPADQR